MSIADHLLLFSLPRFDRLDGLLVAECEPLSDGNCDNFWLPVATFENNQAVYALEVLIRMLYVHIMKDRMPEKFAGTELWVQVQRPQFHAHVLPLWRDHRRNITESLRYHCVISRVVRVNLLIPAMYVA
jgi:hypothetical protein